MIRLAWRNLWRNRTRSVITSSAISLSLALQLVAYGISDSAYGKMIDAAVRSAGGSVLVHAEGWWESRATDQVLLKAEQRLQVIESVPGVRAAIPRVIVNGLVSSARGNAGVVLMGVDAAREAQLNDMGRFLKSGVFVGAPTDLRNPIVLTRKVATDLKLELNDRVVVTTTDTEGEVTRLAFRLAGVLDTGSGLVDALAYTPIGSLQRQLRITDTVTQIGVLVDSDEARAEVAARLKQSLAPGGEVLTWDEAMPEMVGFIEVDRRTGTMFGFFIFIVVAFGIANTMLMAVLERVRELGLLGALGLSPGGIARLVLVEATLLGLVSIAWGVLLAFAGHRWIAAEGLDYSEMVGGEGLEISGVLLEDMVMYSVITPDRWLYTCIGVLVLVVISALYPAWRAARLQPATAMRTYA